MEDTTLLDYSRLRDQHSSEMAQKVTFRKGPLE